MTKLKNKIYLVTGASGHLGNTVVRKLLQNGERVRCLIVEKDVPLSLKDLDCEIIHGDICHEGSLEKFFSGLQGLEVYVLHLAGIISIAGSIDPLLLQVNVGGTENVIKFCRRYKVKRLLYCSSVHAIPEKKYNALISEVAEFDSAWVKGAYAKTKAMASQMVLDAGKEGLDVVIVHPSGIIGPYDYLVTGHINQVIEDFLNGKLRTIVNGGYDIVDVRDVAWGIIQALDCGVNGQCYILSNQYISIQKMLDLAAEISEKPPIRTVLCLDAVRVFAPLIEWWAKLSRKRPLFTDYSLYTLGSNANFSHAKAEKELSYKPRSIVESLKDTIRFIKSRASNPLIKAHKKAREA